MRPYLFSLFIWGIVVCTNAQIISVTYHTGVADSNGKLLIRVSKDTVFSFIDPNNSKLLRASVNNKTGVIDTDRNIIIPFEYDRIYKFFYDYTLAEKDGKWGIIDKRGNTISPFELEEIKFLNKDLVFATFNDKYGAIDTKGTIKTPFIYDKIIVNDDMPEFYWGSLYAFHDTQYAVIKDHRTGAIDSTGRQIVVCKYDNIGTYDGWYTSVEDNGKWGYVDTLGHVAIPFVYDKAYPFVGDIAVVVIDEKYGIINRKGKLITPCKYDYIENDRYGCSIGTINGKYRIISRKGKEILTAFDDIENLKNGLYAVHKNGKVDRQDEPLFAIVDSRGKMVQPYSYTDISDKFEDGILMLKKGRFYGGINSEGKEIIPFIYEFLIDNSFVRGVLRVERDGKEGLINTQGKELLPCQLENVDFPNHSKLTFLNHGFYGVFDIAQEKVLFSSSDYEALLVTGDNTIWGKKDNKWALINEGGQPLTPFLFDTGYPISKKLITTIQNRKYGLIDITGKSILPCIYDQIEVSGDERIIILKNEKERKEIFY